MTCSVTRTTINQNLTTAITQAATAEGAFRTEGTALVPLKDVAPTLARLTRAYGTEVLKMTPAGHYTVQIPTGLTLRYLYAQEGSGEEIQNVIRETYLSNFGEGSLNLLGENRWLDHPMLEDPTTEKLLAFARKLNPHFRVSEVEGLDQNAVSLLRDYVILVRDGKLAEELPEEVAHFFVALLPEDGEAYRALVGGIVNHPVYGETYEAYKTNPAYQKDGKPNIEKIKKEAAGKLLSQYIRHAYHGTADSVYKGKRPGLRELVRRVMNFLKKAFRALSSRQYSEPVDYFRKSADQILSGDLSDLDLQKPIDPYDSVFFSTIDDNTDPLYEGTELAKSAHAVARGMNIMLRRRFFTFLKENNLVGLEKFLQDEKFKDFNKVWDVIELLEQAEEEFSFIKSEENLVEFRGAALKLAEAYNELEQIPKAMEEVLKRLKAEKAAGTLSDSELANKLSEIQKYLHLSRMFSTITKNFTALIRKIKDEDGPGYGQISEDILQNLESIEQRFSLADEGIFNILKDYLINLTNNATEDLFAQYTKTITEMAQKAETEAVKVDLQKRLAEMFSNKEQIAHIINGTLPHPRPVYDSKGQPIRINLDNLKDLSSIDYLLFLSSGTTTLADPFVATAMSFYISKVLEYHAKSQLEERSLAKRILPILGRLSNRGLGYYEAQQKVQTTQDFYDSVAEDHRYQRRTLLSQMNRFDFQFEKIKLEQERNRLRREITQLRASKKNTDPAGHPALDEEIGELTKQYNSLTTELDTFLRTYSHRPYTDKYYEIMDFMKGKSTDSTALKDLRKLESSIRELEQKVNSYLANGGSLDSPYLRKYSDDLADRYTQRIKLRDQLPQREKELYELYQKIREEDQLSTSRVVLRHKRNWVNNYIQTQTALIRSGEVKGDIKDLPAIAEDLYKLYFTVPRPTEEFWAAKKALDEKIDEANARKEFTVSMIARRKELEEKKNKLLAAVRDYKGDVSLTALRGAKGANGQPVYKELFDLDDEIAYLHDKLRLLGSLSRTVDEKIVRKLSAIYDVNYLLRRVKEQPSLGDMDIVALFQPYFTMGPATAARLRDSLQKDEPLGTLLQGLTPVGLGAEVLKYYRQTGIDPGNFETMDDNLQLYVRSNGLLDEGAKNELAYLYEEREKLFSRQLSTEYVFGVLRMMDDVMAEIIALPRDSALRPDPEVVAVLERKRRMANTEGGSLFDLKNTEAYLGDDVFSTVVNYLKKTDPAQAEFLLAVHEVKGLRENRYVSPRYFFSRIMPTDPAHYTEEEPRFLKRTRVRDFYEDEQGNQIPLRTERLDETHPDVVSGAKKATVDLNGEWLPKEEKFVTAPDGSQVKNRFWNDQYEQLKTSTNDTDQTLFELLREYTRFYLDKQKSLPEGERLDLVLPSRMVDHFEGIKLHLSTPSEWYKNIRERLALRKVDESKVSAETRNFNEEMGIITKENRDLYTGLVTGENTIKLDSRRHMPVQRVSQDILGSLAFFIADINEYTAKSLSEPVFQSFADVFERTFHDTSSRPKKDVLNKNRAAVFQNLRDQKIYDIKPDNFANNPTLARVLRVVNSLAVRKLLLDPLGAAVNLVGGELQQLIHAGFDKAELAAYATTAPTAVSWAQKYVAGTFTREKKPVEVQLADSLGFIPDQQDLSKYLSRASVATDLRHIAMSPRSITEIEMGMHLGLALMETRRVEHNGKVYKWQDLYTLDGDGNIILKKEFRDDKAFADKYRLTPETGEGGEELPTGTEVQKFRLKMVSTYTLIQGNYYKFNADYMSTTALGRTMELMKNWFMTGYTKRWQGRVLDLYGEEERIGSHYAMVGLMKRLFQAVNPFDREHSIDTFKDYWSNGRTKAEKTAQQQSLSEIGLIILFGTIFMALLGYDSDDKDRNRRLKAMSWLHQIGVLMTMRAASELGTYIPLPFWGLGLNEVKRYLFDPLSGGRAILDNVTGVSAMGVYHLQDWMGIGDKSRQLYFQKDAGYWYKEKGDSKLIARLLNTIGYTGYTLEPEQYIKTLTQLQIKL